MALIVCPVCGKQMSDKAAACPHCGSSTSGTAAPQQTASAPVYSAPAKSSPNKIGLIVGIVAAVAAVILVIVFASSSGSGSSGSGSSMSPSGGSNSSMQSHSGGSAGTTTSSQPVKVYDVVLTVDCEDNLAFSRYDVDIILDGKTLDTLAHGHAEKFTGTLEAGTHKIVFCKNGDSSVKGEATVNVSGDMSVTFKLECKYDEIKVSRK